MEQLVSTLRMLLRDFTSERRYWDKMDCLNSDGRRLLHRILKQLISEKPELLRITQRVRRNPCLDELTRLLEILEETP